MLDNVVEEFGRDMLEKEEFAGRGRSTSTRRLRRGGSTGVGLEIAFD
jgi:hypothetical protein